MRRRLVVLPTALVVMGLAVAAAPRAAAAHPAASRLLWVATATQTLAYDQTTTPPTLVASTDDKPTGSFARATTLGHDVVYASTQTGVDAFDPQTGKFAFGFSANPTGYAQIAALPDGSKVYGLRTDRTVVDVFADSTQLIRSIALPGPATYMSDARPPSGDVIVFGSVLNSITQKYVSASITTANDSLTTFNAGTTHVTNGTAWQRDGSSAYLSSATQGSSTGSIGRFVPPNQVTDTPVAFGLTPRQILTSLDGSQLYVPMTNAFGSGPVQVLDIPSLASRGTYPGAVNETMGFPALAPDGKLYVTTGPNVDPGLVGITDTTRGVVERSLDFDDVPTLGAYTSAKAAALQATGGANQKMYQGQIFDDPAVTTVVDAAGHPVPCQLVQWTVTPAGAATLQGCVICYARSGLDGTVSSPLIVAGANPGDLSVVATPVQAAPGATAAQFPMTILPPAIPPTVTALAAGDGQVAVTFTPGDAHGISPPTGFRVDATDVFNPAGRGQSATGGTTPVTVTGLTNGETYTFTVTAITPEGDWTSARSDRITAGISASITGTPPPAEVGKPYRFTFTVSGAPTPVVEFNAAATPLPNGLSFDATTATISGTPTAVGSAFLFITATNAVGSSQVQPTLVINPATPPRGFEPTPSTTTTAMTTTTSPGPSLSSGSRPPTSAGSQSAAFNSQPLASTGMPAARIAGTGLLLVILGGLALVLDRRRRSATG